MNVLDLEEEWRPIANFPYEVSALGRVRRAQRGDSHNAVAGAILTPFLTGPSNRRRYSVRLYKENEHKDIFVHKLVCVAFHGERPSPNHQAAHNDGNRLNNAYTNLTWKTASENQRDRISHGTHSSGERSHFAKLTESEARNVKYLIENGFDYKDLVKLWNISHTHIYRIKNGRSWPHLQDVAQ